MLLKHYSGTIVVVWTPSSQIRAGLAKMPGSSGVVEGGVGGRDVDEPIKRKSILVGSQRSCLQWSVPSADVGAIQKKLVGIFPSVFLTSSIRTSHPPEQ